jgi:hypothetical protein
MRPLEVESGNTGMSGDGPSKKQINKEIHEYSLLETNHELL